MPIRNIDDPDITSSHLILPFHRKYMIQLCTSLNIELIKAIVRFILVNQFTLIKITISSLIANNEQVSDHES